MGQCALYCCPISGLPYLVLEPIFRVEGEIYRVSAATLGNIDDLEGHPESYTRVSMEVEIDGVGVVEAQAYAWMNHTDDLILAQSGDWTDSLESD